MRRLVRVVPVRTRNWLLLSLSRFPIYGQRIVPRTLFDEKWLLSTGTKNTSALISTLSVDENASLSFADLDPESLLAVARVMSFTARTEQQKGDALETYEMAMTRDGTNAFTHPGLVPQSWRHGQIVASLAIELGLSDRAQEFVASFPVGSKFYDAMKVDLLNPLLNPTGSRADWLGAFNQLAGWHGDWSISEGPAISGHVLDNIRTDLVTGSADGPLVTVVVASYQPDPQHLRTAVRSFGKQTMGNLEILIVDDASGSEWKGIYEELAATDDRIRILYQSVNLGAYAARNLGMTQARGEFVTFHDSDDWAHPSRIEYQLRPLLVNGSKVIATHSSALRTRNNLILSFRSSESQWTNPSSILVRRKTVLDRAGYFVASRKSADTEYAVRLKKVFPGLVLSTQATDVAVEPVLGLTRLTPESLSRRDFSIGFSSPERLAFFDALRYWHATLDTEHAFVPMSNTSPFPVPRSFRHTVPDQGTFDVVLAMDGRTGVRASKWWFDAMIRWSRSGLKVGLIHMFARGTGDTGSIRMSKVLMKALAAGGIEHLRLTDNVVAQTLVVPDPSVFSVQPPPGVLLTTSRTLINDSLGKEEEEIFTEKAVQICSEIFFSQPILINDIQISIDGFLADPGEQQIHFRSRRFRRSRNRGARASARSDNRLLVL